MKTLHLGFFCTYDDSAPLKDKRAVAFNWGATPVRGVNIGGWLVLEP